MARDRSDSAGVRWMAGLVEEGETANRGGQSFLGYRRLPVVGAREDRPGHGCGDVQPAFHRFPCGRLLLRDRLPLQPQQVNRRQMHEGQAEAQEVAQGHTVFEQLQGRPTP